MNWFAESFDTSYFFWLIFYFLIFASSLTMTFFSRFLAIKYNILDKASSAPSRKFQETPVPLFGAFGFVLVASLATGLVWLGHKFGLISLPNLIYPFRLFWIILAILILGIVGLLDDLAKIKPRFYILGVVLAIILAVWAGGLKIEVLSYPFDSYNFGNFSYFLAFLWLLVCTASTKFVDGSDGLASTIAFVGFLTIAVTANQINQPFIVIFAMIWAVGILGFLPFNFPKAKLYLGDGGSLIIGFVIGVLSILGGAKVATAGTVLGWFILDIILVMLTRIIRKQNILHGDSQLHWHHRLTKIGFSRLQVLVFTTFILLVSANIGIFFFTFAKFWIILAQLFLLIFIFLPKK